MALNLKKLSAVLPGLAAMAGVAVPPGADAMLMDLLSDEDGPRVSAFATMQKYNGLKSLSPQDFYTLFFSLFDDPKYETLTAKIMNALIEKGSALAAK